MVVLLAKEEQGIQSPKSKRARTSARKSHEFLSPFAIATPCCQQNFRYFSPPRRAEGLQTPEATDRRPCLLQCFLPAPPPPLRRRRDSSQHLPGPQPHTTSETPQTPTSTEANHISASVEFVRSSSLEWRSIRAWVDFVFWWLESLLLAEASSVVNQRFC